MNVLEGLETSERVTTLLGTVGVVPLVDCKFDNRDTWDKRGRNWDNRSDWDNWDKKK
ncbi:multiple cyclophane-containing RiPP AmcA [Nocardiopsis sp. NPDC049922]|uniref:multiple cyclophane-containing RiPP AmcA n=1 Tax=Nocardiopsis sp. NPDC049922 TaxID=3155157 RepID=UPI0033EACA83